MCSLLAVCALAAAAASWDPSVAAQQQTPPSLDQEIATELRNSRALSWSATRPLKWSDFEATPPIVVGQLGAVTAYSLVHGARCTGRRFQFKAVTAFVPGRSWVQPTVLGDPARTISALRHEQTHFDLAEVFARRMRRQFGEMVNPCRETQGSLESLATRFVGDDVAAQAKYDDETRHGLLAERQRQWDADTAAMLMSLAKFESR